MSDILTPLTIDFLAWLARKPRPYTDVMDAWRTSCPRLTVWEDAIDAGLVSGDHVSGPAVRVALTERGEASRAGARLVAAPTRKGCGAPFATIIGRAACGGERYGSKVQIAPPHPLANR